MKSFCFFVLWLWCSASFSQNTFLESFYTSGSAQNMFGKTTSNSGYLLYGFNDFTGNNLFAKADSNGTIEFCKYYNLPLDYLVINAFENQNEYKLLCVGINNTICTINVDLNGNFISGTSYYSPQGAISFNLLGQIGSDVYFCGRLGQNSALVKMDSSGIIKWAKVYATYSSSGFMSGVISNNNEIYVTGSIQDPLNSITSILKVDTSGNIIWSKQFQMNNRFQVATTEESGLIITMFDLAIKFDSSGAIEWSKIYNVEPAYFLTAKGIKRTKDQGYIIGGQYTPYNIGFPQPSFLLHIDQTGVADWINTFGTLNTQEVASCDIASDSGYVVIGTTQGFTSTSTPKGFMFKTDISGNLGCFDNPVSVTDSAIILSNIPTTFTTSSFSLSDTTFLPIPFVTDQPGNFICSSTANITQQSFSKCHLYPNPICDKAMLVVSDVDKYFFIAYNTFGKIIFEADVNSLETEFDFSNLQNGIYYYQLSNSENNIIGKFIVAKQQ